MKKKRVLPSGSQELKKRLPRGAIKALANKYGYSLVWISRLVTGTSIGDPRILEDAFRIAKLEDAKRAAVGRIVNLETSETQQP